MSIKIYWLKNIGHRVHINAELIMYHSKTSSNWKTVKCLSEIQNMVVTYLSWLLRWSEVTFYGLLEGGPFVPCYLVLITWVSPWLVSLVTMFGLPGGLPRYIVTLYGLLRVALLSLVKLYCLIRGRPRWCLLLPLWYTGRITRCPLLPCMVY